eukprot:1312322-Rhodomonas_salina.3
MKQIFIIIILSKLPYSGYDMPGCLTTRSTLAYCTSLSKVSRCRLPFSGLRGSSAAHVSTRAQAAAVLWTTSTDDFASAEPNLELTMAGPVQVIQTVARPEALGLRLGSCQWSSSWHPGSRALCEPQGHCSQ